MYFCLLVAAGTYAIPYFGMEYLNFYSCRYVLLIINFCVSDTWICGIFQTILDNVIFGLSAALFGTIAFKSNLLRIKISSWLMFFLTSSANRRITLSEKSTDYHPAFINLVLKLPPGKMMRGMKELKFKQDLEQNRSVHAA